PPIWRPSPVQVRDANLTQFVTSLRARGELAAGTDGVPLPYGVLHEWSIRNSERFWRATADFCGLIADGFDSSTCIGLDRMAPPDPVRGPKWFDGTKLNFAENLLRYRDDRTAIVSWNESGRQQQLSFAELGGEVSRIATALREMGVGIGDRVAGFLPNIPETIVAMLATTTLGAVWSSCSPDFGVQGALDRFGQIEPTVLVCADGYRYAGKEIDCLQRVRGIAEGIPSIKHIVVVPYLNHRMDVGAVPRAVRWDSLRRFGDAPEFERLPFDHPVYIMYSSGTTGLPKCMVHGAGGTLLQHLKELALHTGMTREDRIFYFTTCGWMMWNWMLSSLAVGSAVVLYDGPPLQPRAEILWDLIEAERVTVFGTSAKYLALAEKSDLAPGMTHDITSLRAILSTGSPLAEHSYDYVYERIKREVHLASISGGTDIISCFALGNPTSPVYRGEIQCRGLGMAVEVLGPKGNAVSETPGELVCTRAFPSMPIGFWNDADGAKYRAAYFDFYPHVWRHGDWAELTEHDGVIIYGRSDATLNPGGVRIGTAEIYRQVEQLPEVLESVAVGQEVGNGVRGDVRIVLFVRLQAGIELSEELVQRIKTRIRSNTTPLHVPKVVVQVADIPRTVSGKITEIAVREVIHGRPVTNVEALANPGALELFRNLPELLHTSS
ncbi:MAG TPA: acetoacetate--CoA ligase, partial [Gemmatimonadaceae bacterium]